MDTVRITVDVTPDDIIQGERISPSRCPIALACRRQFDHPLLGSRYIGSSDFDEWIPVPHAVQLAISDFDVRGLMVPFTFDLDVPASWLG